MTLFRLIHKQCCLKAWTKTNVQLLGFNFHKTSCRHLGANSTKKPDNNQWAFCWKACTVHIYLVSIRNINIPRHCSILDSNASLDGNVYTSTLSCKSFSAFMYMISSLPVKMHHLQKPGNLCVTRGSNSTLLNLSRNTWAVVNIPYPWHLRKSKVALSTSTLFGLIPTVRTLRKTSPNFRRANPYEP